MAEEEDRPGAPGGEADDYGLWATAALKLCQLAPGLPYEAADAALRGACLKRVIDPKSAPCHKAQGVDDWKIEHENTAYRYAAWLYLPDLPKVLSLILPKGSAPQTTSPKSPVRTKRTLPLAELEAKMRRRAEGKEIEREWSREADALSDWAANQPSLSGLPHKPGSIRRRKRLRAVHLELIEKYRG